jgi:hypothetical protein
MFDNSESEIRLYIWIGIKEMLFTRQDGREEIFMCDNQVVVCINYVSLA